MHWIEKEEMPNCTAALENASKGIKNLDGSLKTLHGTESSEQNMWYQFDYSRAGYMAAGSNLVNLLKGNSDPRESIYFENTPGTGIVDGADPGESYNNHSYLNDEYFGSDASIDIVSYEENLLIQAECKYRLGEPAIAKTLLEEAQIAAETKWGVTIPDISSTDDLWNKILEEKYIALFLNSEIWNDYKRNCYPDVKYKKSDDDDGNPIYVSPPVRVYYPEDERKTNTNIPQVVNQPSSNDNDTVQCATE